MKKNVKFFVWHSRGFDEGVFHFVAIIHFTSWTMATPSSQDFKSVALEFAMIYDWPVSGLLLLEFASPPLPEENQNQEEEEEEEEEEEKKPRCYNRLSEKIFFIRPVSC